MDVDWQAIRREFPALQQWTALNTATFGQIPRRAVEAMHRHLRQREEHACWDFLSWFDDADQIRALAARLIHCVPEDIAFVTNAATALGILIGGLLWNPGDRVVTLAGEFPNNLYYPAQLVRRGVEFVETPFEGFYDAVTPNTRLVILSTINYTTGFQPPLDEISVFLRRRGVLLYVDTTQSLGAIQFDTWTIQPAMMAVDAYKWLLGPSGSGFIYVRPDLRTQLAPTVIGWRSHKAWREVDNLHHGAPEFCDAAEKYEGGMLNFPSLYAMGASIEMMLEIGPANIERRVGDLAAQTRGILRRCGARLACDEAPYFDSPIVTARFPSVDASVLSRELKARRVLVSARRGSLRVSPHFYNNEADLEVFGRTLRELL
jgi:cysteine desulfurase/selenocysteine lyase